MIPADPVGPPVTAWPHPELARTWQEARTSAPPGYLNAAACNIPSDTVLAAVVDHLHLERMTGGYEAEGRAASVLAGARADLASYVGHSGRDVGFVESGSVAMANLLGGWRLPVGARVGVVRSEYGSNRMVLVRLAAQRGWELVELPVDADSRLLPDGLADALGKGLDLVVLPHIASQRGIVQPARAAGRLCRDAGVPLVLDVCQSLGHIDTGGVGAAAYVGTSRKWLAGPRGVGFVIVPGLTEGSGPDTSAPAIGTHDWTDPGGSPVAGAARFETSEASIAARVGLAVAAREHQALGPAPIYERLAAMGRATRHVLDGAGGWRAVEPLDEPTAIVTLRPPAGADPGTAVSDAVRDARGAGVTVGAIPVSRAPADMRTPVLRVSLPLDASPHTVEALATVLTG